MMSFKAELVSKVRVVDAGQSESAIEGYEGGCYHRISHQSASTSTKMIFGLFLPSTYENKGMIKRV